MFAKPTPMVDIVEVLDRLSEQRRTHIRELGGELEPGQCLDTDADTLRHLADLVGMIDGALDHDTERHTGSGCRRRYARKSYPRGLAEPGEAGLRRLDPGDELRAVEAKVDPEGADDGLNCHLPFPASLG